MLIHVQNEQNQAHILPLLGLDHKSTSLSSGLCARSPRQYNRTISPNSLFFPSLDSLNVAGVCQVHVRYFIISYISIFI